MAKHYLLLILFLLISLPVLAQNSQEKQERHSSFSKQLKSEQFDRINNGERLSYFQMNNKQKSSLKYRADKKKKLDSLITFVLNPDTNQFENDFKSEFIYDSNGNLIHDIGLEWYNNTWAGLGYTDKNEYKYNTDGYLIEQITYGSDYNSPEWYLSSKKEYTYDTQGNLAQKIRSEWVNNTMDNYRKYEYTYDAEGNLIQLLAIDWSQSTNQEEYGYKEEYIYDTSRNCTQVLLYRWIISNSQWVVIDNEELSYDTNGNLIQTIDYDWNSNTNQWDYNSKVEFTYDITYSFSELVLPWDYIYSTEFDFRIYIIYLMTNYVSYSYESQNWKEKSETILYYSDYSTDQTTIIPDANFEQALIDLGIDSDGIINQSVATADISGIKTLNVENKEISDLTGIEQFTSIEDLNCSENQIESLDLSQNIALLTLDCSENQIESLDLSKNTVLKELYCLQNQLIGLNVSQNTAITMLACFDNQLSSLDVSQNTALLTLDCSSNQIDKIDISNNVSLTGFSCARNELSSLDISKNTALTLLYCFENLITKLDISQNIALTDLDCFNNQLINLDVSQNVNLQGFWCNDNQLTNIDVTQNINLNDDANWSTTNWTNIDAQSIFSEGCSQTTTITDSNFEQALIDLGIISDSSVDGSVTTYEISAITSLDISGKNISDLTGIEDFTNLETLIVSNNQLTSLDLSNNPNLIFLDTSNNPLTTIVLTNDTAPKSSDSKTGQQVVLATNNNILKIDIHDTDLTEVDLSNIPNLETLIAQGSKLATLDVSNNANLTVLNITNNPIICVQVSQTQLDNIPTGWEKDATATYHTDCQSYLGIDDELLAKSINLYPNPASEILTIDSKLQITKVEIYSILGQIVKEVNIGLNSISLNGLSKGIYLLRIESENGTTVRKLIKL